MRPSLDGLFYCPCFLGSPHHHQAKILEMSPKQKFYTLKEFVSIK